MNYLIEIHDPGSGSVKPIDNYYADTPEEVYAACIHFGRQDRAVRVKENNNETAPDALPATDRQVG